MSATQSYFVSFENIDVNKPWAIYKPEDMAFTEEGFLNIKKANLYARIDDAELYILENRQNVYLAYLKGTKTSGKSDNTEKAKRKKAAINAANRKLHDAIKELAEIGVAIDKSLFSPYIKTYGNIKTFGK